MKNKILRNLLAVTLGLILSSSAVGVFGIATSRATDTYSWRLRVDTVAPLELSISDLKAMPRTVVYAELYCYGKLITEGDWAGVNLWLLLEKAGVNQQTYSIEFHASDGVKITLSIEDAQRDDVIVAYERDGQPLSEALRLVVPGQNGNVWIAWITEITVVGSGQAPATPKSSSNYSSPQKPSASPRFSISSPENIVYNVNSVPLNFSVNKPSSNMRYSLDGRGNVSIAGNVTLSNLPNGSHNLTMYATDESGKTGVSEINYFSVDVRESFPTTYAIAAIVIVSVVVGAGLGVYFKKPKQ